MAQPYKLISSLPYMAADAVVRLADGVRIPFDPANLDYQAYDTWRQIPGNEPDPPDLVAFVTGTPPEREVMGPPPPPKPAGAGVG